MLTKEQTQLSEFLKAIAEELDIPDSRYEEAVKRYMAVSKYLATAGSPLEKFRPELYPQGSFRLGTVVKPLSDSDDYDIDLVCRLAIQKDTVRQTQLKAMVGDRLKQDAAYQKMLEEKQRCWRLDYANEFHMDILPAIPDPCSPGEVILVPDAKLDDGDWHVSNPKGYAAWFKERMAVVYRRRLATFAESARTSIEAVPEWRVKTPLQRAVQILKRHRDVMFQDDPEGKPVSIIVTTLAAHAYNNEEDLCEAIDHIVGGMPGFIEQRNGAPWVPNPVNARENFADKWREHPEREVKFTNWLQQVRRDLQSALAQADRSVTAANLVAVLGAGPVKRAQRRLGIPIKTTTVVAGGLATRSRSFFAVSYRQPPIWPVELSESVSIAASAHKGKGGVKFQDIPSDRQRPICKGIDLQYRASTAVRPPYELYWQVANTGAEAAAAGALRGAIFKGESIQWERTLYTGSHWIECFVVKDGVCVARSGEFVITIE